MKTNPHHKRFDLTLYIRSWLAGRRERDQYRNLKRYLMFIGYPRSGHSLVGAHLTAHPNMVISNELHALGYFKMGYRRTQLLHLIQQRDRHFVARDCRSGKYSYAIPGQWQGRYQKLTVIGDKKGGGSTSVLLRKPQLLDRFRSCIGLPLGIIHVIRNPFDTIARIQLKADCSLESAVDQYTRLCQGNAALIERCPDEILTMRHEDYIAQPRVKLAELCRFAGVPFASAYLDQCAANVYRSPNRTRDEIQWPSAGIARVEQLIEKHHFLHGYTFVEEASVERQAA